MDYATYPIGAAAPAPKQKAKAAAPKRRAVSAYIATKKGHRRGACRPPALSPCIPAAYGFLKTRFLVQMFCTILLLSVFLCIFPKIP